MLNPFGQQNAISVLQKQNYTEMNRGDMYVPVGRVDAPLNIAVAATPHFGAMPVHAVPVTYMVNSANILTGARAVRTPNIQAVNPNGY
ncbi:hypothetical protein [Alicyclobacillus acidoterrestris]|uniref:Uncharacterized protein n=1 Tax=Alicyclobacillus acidoterrestris (strain ATCC 49025 / DSM 3922 / CIP 106132 / NCIMB 13137 / GD3B) TaxID=1356854 RepID=T0BTN4_ALIAG|nr:hypothetical protein [Alicyclobacillus acidoterrestris]EPZ43830.1 hypothetical protein N007_11980 [Alicyclobacillus acidoterrestris ATCC 49025]UNO49038.1 hypothetical protein K1I37_00225 [Alicyclobacillus acidoterrestris]